MTSNVPFRPVVWLVEDDRPLRTLFADELADNGFDVVAFASAEEAIVRLGAAPPAVLVTDYSLQGACTGLDLACQLQNHAPQAAIVVISGRQPEELMGLRKLNGNVAVLSKPLTLESLVGTVGQMTQEPRH